MIKKDSKTRLFEVMGRLDKTFKPTLNEGFEEPEVPEVSAEVDLPVPTGEETPEVDEVPEVEEKSPEEKIQELTAKVDELYAMLHGDATEEPEAEEADIDVENLQEWNFDKKKGEEHEEKAEDKEEDEKEEKEDLDEEIETPAKPKIPVAAVAKVGK